MLRILTTTAFAALIATPVFATSHVSSEGDGTMGESDTTAAMTDSGSDAAMDDTATANMDELIRTRDITGGPIYSVAAAYDEGSWMSGDTMAYGYENMGYGTDYAQIGEIEDIVLDMSGQMIGIVAEIGGFLDIGDKHVMLPVEDVRLVAVDDATYSFVTRKTEEELEALPAVDEAWFD
ncbi:PRC-barrel domain-containing protein [Jannaschia ovalis]|uniref:PRC-barrel domain-containing protein n=1 Tax=Jannaschia ovalis TaxID=3038773 RepID=A0ABY8L9R1_9RHOB|nr:PRC-barrel domain-containing protein [Jannaschia sp. GRR-S6-38]WGH78099.1 PRC-barrel domain-containing protein [Jannaschia sp. GRR-S6-38]